MASLFELNQFFDDADLLAKVTSATVIAANNLLANPEVTEDEKRFAARTFQNQKAMGNIVLKAVVADNKDASVAQIQSASDAAIQTRVNAVIASLVGV